MRRWFLLFGVSATVGFSGCHSHYIQTTITNHSGSDLNVIQVEYPGAAFGTQSVKPGAEFHYRFKLLGSGKLKVTWTDAAGQERTQGGPQLNEGQEGALTIDFPSQVAATFQVSLVP